MYKELQKSLKAEIRMRSYEDIIFNCGLSMFSYTGVEKEFALSMEKYLLLTGQCAVWKYDDKLIVTQCERVGTINEYGLGVDLVCTTRNGIQETFKNFEQSQNVVYIRNNSLAYPDNSIEWYASTLAEIDKSIVHNILNARYSPLVKARNTKEKSAIELALENNNGNGKPQVVMVGMDDLFETSQNYNNVLNITDVTNADKIQYLSHAHDDIMRRLYNLYGMDISGTGKMAQQTVEEITNGDNSVMIVPNDRLQQRKDGMKEVSEKFGINATVDYSVCWKREDNERTISCVDTTNKEIKGGENNEKNEVV